MKTKTDLDELPFSLPKYPYRAQKLCHESYFFMIHGDVYAPFLGTTLTEIIPHSTVLTNITNIPVVALLSLPKDLSEKKMFCEKAISSLACSCSTKMCCRKISTWWEHVRAGCSHVEREANGLKV